MRKDEEYIKQSIKGYLSSRMDKFDIIDGEDSPDYYVVHKNKKILLEVTRAEPIYSENGNIKNRNTLSMSITRLCKDLNSKMGKFIKPNESLLIEFIVPLINYNKFKNKIETEIFSIIKDKHYISITFEEFIELRICGNLVKFRLFKNTPHRDRIIGVIKLADNNSIPDIQEQVSLILSDIIKKKEKKTRIISEERWIGEKWLAIYNGYWLSSSDTYKKVLQEVNIKHTFNKIFLVEENFNVIEIFSI